MLSLKLLRAEFWILKAISLWSKTTISYQLSEEKQCDTPLFFTFTFLLFSLNTWRSPLNSLSWYVCYLLNCWGLISEFWKPFPQFDLRNFLLSIKLGPDKLKTYTPGTIDLMSTSILLPEIFMGDLFKTAPVIFWIVSVAVWVINSPPKLTWMVFTAGLGSSLNSLMLERSVLPASLISLLNDTACWGAATGIAAPGGVLATARF